MATNKNATIRYQALDKCFRNPGRKYFIDDLLEACNQALLDYDPDSTGIQLRQLREDISFMRDPIGYDAPIEAIPDPKKCYYRYSDLNYSITNQPLNEQEAQQLKESLLTLSRYKGLPQFEWVEEMAARLEQTFHLKTEENILSFEENQYLTGREHIGDIYNAIVNQRVLKIAYKPFKADNELNFELHPYHLKQYNNRWFLFGLNNEYLNLTNLALDRIQNFTECNIEYIKNDKIDFNEYFDDVIGVSVNVEKPTEKVVIKVDAEQLPYIVSKPIHGSQKIKWSNEGEAFVELELQLNFELEALLFSFGEKIEVIHPESLRDGLMKRVKALLNKYNSSQ